MKSIFPYLIPAASLAVALPAVHAGGQASGQASSEKKEMRVIVGPDDGPDHPTRRVIHIGGDQEMESVVFLGVETRPTDATLAEQLNLSKGTGLIVRDVVPDSPAAATLKRNDVLVKVDDQLLIEQRQLSVLIRNHKEGDEVTLTFIRGGKETTAKVKLVKHDVPKMAMMHFGPGFGGGAINLPQGDDDGQPGMGREDMDRVLSLIDQHHPGLHHRTIHIDRDDGPGVHTTTVSTSNSNMVFSDEKGSLDLTIKDGKQSLVAKNAKGEQLFSGPVTTPEERKALPADVRERLEKLEGMQDFSFQTDDDFQGGKVQVVKPGKTKISLPADQSAAPAGRPPMKF